MKKLFTLLTIAISLNVFLTTKAAVLTVDNNVVLSGSPGMYTDLQAACTAANAGDTILVAGSPTYYSGTIIIKKLIILGAGYNPQKQNLLKSSASFTLGNGSSNTHIEGFEGAFSCNATALISGITISRNNMSLNLQGTKPAYIDNLLVINNIFNGYCCLNYCGGITLANNIFMGGYTLGASDKPTVFIKNNLFLNNSGIFDGVWPVSNAIISNNIFNEAIIGQTFVINCSFNNNLTYNCANNNNTLPFGSNVGSGNIINQDPVFTKIASSTFSYTNNYMIHSSSPCKNAGTDGTDIGPSGGSYPFTTSFPLTGMPAIPVITQMQINGASSVPYGNSTINVNVKAKKIN